jgi:hypothetical protein
VRVMLGMPTYGQIEGRTADCVDAGVGALRSAGHAVDRFRVTEPGITTARTVCVAAALMQGSDALIQVDHDMVFAPTCLLALVQALVACKHVVGVTYAAKRLEWSGVQEAVVAGVPPEDLAAMGSKPQVEVRDKKIPGFRLGRWEYATVDSVGTGVFATSRECLTRMVAAYPETEDPPSPLHDMPWPYLFDNEFRPTADGVRRYMGEDWVFCKRWRAIGGSVHVLTNEPVGHLGTFEYRTDFQAFCVRRGIAVTYE